MVSGSDSHGAPVVFKAEEQGITPEEMAERSHQGLVDVYSQLGFVYENYTKTTTDLHKEVAQNIFLVLKENGYLKAEKSNQYFDEEVQRFLPDRYVRGTCPICRATNARGDECPECGEFLEPEDLIDPYSTLSDSIPVMKETEHFYMDLTSLQPKLKDWIENNSDHWRKWVREFSLGWIKQGLQPRPVTRDMKFGVKVPVEGWEDKVLYVWIEAVVGYLSASIEWAEKQGKPSDWESYWKDPKCRHYYMLSGGNVPFHTIMWPAELIAYNEKYESPELVDSFKLPGETLNKPLNLPYDVPGNKMLTHGGKKMSKGDGTGVTLERALKYYGADTLRYFFTRYAPENQDREYTWKDFIDANNNELVANIGNFINRALSFGFSRFDGKIPDGNLENSVNEAINIAFEKSSLSLENTEFVKSIETILELGKFANKYFNDEAPWETIKETPEKAANTIYNSIQLVNALRILLKPFTPFASAKLSEYLNITDEYDPTEDVRLNGAASQNIDQWCFVPLQSGHPFEKPEILFPKYEYTKELEAEDNDEVSLDDKYMGIIIAEVLERSEHPSKSDLAVYLLDIGKEKVTVVSKDNSLKIGDKAAYFGIGTVIPGSKGREEVQKAMFDEIESIGMLASAKELDITNSHKVVLKLKTESKPGTSFAEAFPQGYPIEDSVEVDVSKELDFIPIGWRVYTNLKISKLKPDQRVKLKELYSTLYDSLKSDSAWRDRYEYKGYRELHNKYSSEKDLIGSSQALCETLLEQGSIGKVNALVDIYNYVSALTGVSIGIHDISLLQGNPTLEVLKIDTKYQEVGTGDVVTVPSGEYVYTDEKGIICRLDTKQCQRTRIGPKTENLLIILQGHESLGVEDLEEAAALLDHMIEQFVRQ
jgi:methionyl-tRNA synthetase